LKCRLRPLSGGIPQNKVLRMRLPELKLKMKKKKGIKTIFLKCDSFGFFIEEKKIV
jgi:hypothetical protein